MKILIKILHFRKAFGKKEARQDSYQERQDDVRSSNSFKIKLTKVLCFHDSLDEMLTKFRIKKFKRFV